MKIRKNVVSVDTSVKNINIVVLPTEYNQYFLHRIFQQWSKKQNEKHIYHYEIKETCFISQEGYCIVYADIYTKPLLNMFNVTIREPLHTIGYLVSACDYLLDGVLQTEDVLNMNQVIHVQCIQMISLYGKTNFLCLRSLS